MLLLHSARNFLKTELAVRRTHGIAPRSGAPLPPNALRKGGKHFMSNEQLLQSSLCDVERLETYAGLRGGLHLVDLGSGAGRLAIALLERNFSLNYTGIDVQSSAVRWGSRHLTTFSTNYNFVHVDSHNRRYNPRGKGFTRWPLKENSADLVYAYSVLSHMSSEEVRFQFDEAARVLRPNGVFTITAFVEEDCPEETVNPPGYGPFQWKGECHCVRYEYGYFMDLAATSRFILRHYLYNSDKDGQSFIVFSLR